MCNTEKADLTDAIYESRQHRLDYIPQTSITMFALPLSTALILLTTLLHPISAAKATIKSLTYTGSGCPQGSVSTVIDPDSTSLSQWFDDFPVYIGPGTSITDRSKTCHMEIEFDFEDACTRMVFHEQGMDVTGFLQMDQNVTATVAVGYGWVEAGGQVRPVLVFFGTSGAAITCWLQCSLCLSHLRPFLRFCLTILTCLTQGSSTVRFKGPSKDASGWLGWQHADSAAKDIRTSTCGRGTLIIDYRIALATTGTPCNCGTIGPEPEQQWHFRHSLKLEKCDGCGTA